MLLLQSGVAEEYGYGWAEGVHRDDFDRCVKIYTDHFELQKEFKMDYRLKRHDGAYRWILDHGVPRYTDSGEFAGFIGSCIDIEEKKQTEENLEKIVSTRTRELQQAIRELERSNGELAQFAYAASHDLREPLRKISMFSGGILADPQHTEQCVAKIQQAVQRMTSLIDNLLNLSQVVRDEKLVENIDLNVVLSEVKNDLEVAILEKGAIVTNDELPRLEAIPEQMRQLLSNLLANALKYSHPDRVPEVCISAVLLPSDAEIALPGFESDKKYFELKVEDNGIGFDPKFAEKIFVVFQRLHSQNQYSGTGIGLALCKKVVHNHGGEIYADSVPSQGAIFRAILPLRQQEREGTSLHG